MKKIPYFAVVFVYTAFYSVSLCSCCEYRGSVTALCHNSYSWSGITRRYTPEVVTSTRCQPVRHTNSFLFHSGVLCILILPDGRRSQKSDISCYKRTCSCMCKFYTDKVMLQRCVQSCVSSLSAGVPVHSRTVQSVGYLCFKSLLQLVT